MSTKKSKTAQRRESIADAAPQRALALSLDITPEQYDVFAGLADSYNRMWGSLVSWCNHNRCVNLARVQKENYARLRAKYPELPAQFVCIAIRGGNRALVELKPSETTVEPQSVAQEKDNQLRPESHVPTRQPAIVKRHARAEATADAITRRSRLVQPQVSRAQPERGETRAGPGRSQCEHPAHLPTSTVHARRTRRRARRGPGAARSRHRFERR